MGQVDSRLPAALEWLFSLVNLEAQPPSTWDVERFTLARPAALLEALGSPQRRFRSVLVAGTKGKGSTSMLLASLLHAQDRRVGLYTSPHLLSYLERFQVDGRPISPARFVAAVERIKPCVEQVHATRPELGHLTTYEVTTCLALDVFALEKVEWAVLEVGLGGRLDATNVVEPEVAAITSIGYDHTEVLGPTLADIAREKAGVARTGCPLFVGPVADEAWDSIAETADAYQATVQRVDSSGGYYVPTVRPRRIKTWPPPPSAHVLVTFELNSRVVRDFVGLRLGGRLQVGNARMAVALLEQVDRPPARLGYPTVRHGLARVSPAASRFRLPGRFDFRSHPGVLLDVAHNADSVRTLMAAIDDHFGRRPRDVVLGIAADKDVPAVLRELRHVRCIYAVEAHHPRALPAGQLAALARAEGLLDVTEAGTVEQALGAIFRAADDGTIPVVTGSFHVVAEALRPANGH